MNVITTTGIFPSRWAFMSSYSMSWSMLLTVYCPHWHLSQNFTINLQGCHTLIKIKFPSFFLYSYTFSLRFFDIKTKYIPPSIRVKSQMQWSQVELLGCSQTPNLLQKSKKIPCVEVTLVCKNTFYTVFRKSPVFSVWTSRRYKFPVPCRIGFSPYDSPNSLFVANFPACSWSKCVRTLKYSSNDLPVTLLPWICLIRKFTDARRAGTNTFKLSLKSASISREWEGKENFLSLKTTQLRVHVTDRRCKICFFGTKYIAEVFFQQINSHTDNARRESIR